MCGSSTGSSGGSGGSGGSSKGMSTGDGKYYISGESMNQAKSISNKIDKEYSSKPSGMEQFKADDKYNALNSHFNSGGLKMTSGATRDPQASATLKEKAIKSIMGKEYNKVDEDYRL